MYLILCSFADGTINNFCSLFSKQQTNHQINQLKSIINILNLNNNNSNNNKNKNNEEKIINKDILQDDDEEDDKTSQYSIETIIKTIQESSTLNQFLKRNNKTIFNQQHDKQDLLNNLNNDINLSILESIHNHKKLYYNAKQSIKQSIELTINTKDPYLQTKSSITSKRSTTGIILSTNSVGKIATLFNTNNDNKVIGEIDFIHNINNTYNSIVNTGEYVYIFGGYGIENNGHDRYIRYSIAEKKIDHRGIIDIIDIGCNISTCFDGNEYIYLIGGYNYINKKNVHRIDRFNIKTMKFEKYFQYNNIFHQVLHSFFYNGVIYFMTYAKKIYIFDPITNGLTFDENNDLFINPRSGCSDGKGNIYILSGNNEFIRYNIESKKVDKLSNILSGNRLQSMVYVHGRDGISSRIYLIGGVKLKNYIYTIENNQWSQFYLEDPYDRTCCASVLI